MFMLSAMCVLARWSDGEFVQARRQHEQAGHSLERTMCLSLCRHASMHVCMFVCVCTNFILRAVGAKPKVRACASCKIQRQRNQQKHSIIIVRDCPMFQSLTIKMSRFTVLGFLWNELTVGSQAVCMPRNNSNSNKDCVSVCLYACMYVCAAISFCAPLGRNRKRAHAQAARSNDSEIKKTFHNYRQGPRCSRNGSTRSAWNGR